MRIAFLIILGSILASNTFSTQYLLWLSPFIPFLSRDEAGLAIFISVLTWLYFKYWNDIIVLAPMATDLLVWRNILLILLFIISLYKTFKKD